MTGHALVSALFFSFMAYAMFMEKEAGLAFIFMAIAVLLLLYFLHRFLHYFRLFRENNRKFFYLFIPFASDYQIAKLAKLDKIGRYIVIAEIVMFGSMIGFLFSLIFYSQYSTIYFSRDDNGQFVESLGGPTWIPAYLMIGFGVLFLISLIVLIILKYKVHKALRVIE